MSAFYETCCFKPQRLHCPNCQDTYSLPSAKDGLLRLHGENKCPLDDFDLIYWQGPGGCHECFNPTCSHSFLTLGVVQCPRQCSAGHGVLVLDPQSGPKWRISCNKCSAVVTVFEGALRVKVLTKQCEDCGAQLFLPKCLQDKSPLPKEKTTYRGCVFCDKAISYLVNLNHMYTAEQHRSTAAY
ncbi:DNA topoisomerase [Dirofilaria immitis]|nr:DNA topoisomerase [Dirofilaria immitis]